MRVIADHDKRVRQLKSSVITSKSNWIWCCNFPVEPCSRWSSFWLAVSSLVYSKLRTFILQKYILQPCDRSGWEDVRQWHDWGPWPRHMWPRYYYRPLSGVQWRFMDYLLSWLVSLVCCYPTRLEELIFKYVLNPLQFTCNKEKSTWSQNYFSFFVGSLYLTLSSLCTNLLLRLASERNSHELITIQLLKSSR